MKKPYSIFLQSILFFLLITFFNAKIHAQNDSILAQKYFYKANKTFNTNRKIALKLYQKSFKLLNKKHNSEHLVVILNTIGLKYFKIYEPDSAIFYLDSALSLGKKILPKNNPKIGVTYNLLGHVYHRKSNQKKLLYYFKKALEIRLIALGESSKHTGSTSIQLAKAYQMIGDFKNAEKYYRLSVKIFKKAKIKNKRNLALANAHLSFSNMYFKSRDFDKAISLLETARALAIKSEKYNAVFLNRCDIELAKNYKEKKEYEKAITLLKKSENFFKKTPRDFQVYEVQKLISEILIDLNRLDEAIKYLESVDAFILKYHSKEHYYFGKNAWRKAMVYKLKKLEDLELKYLKIALKTTKLNENKNLPVISKINLLLAKHYENKDIEKCKKYTQAALINLALNFNSTKFQENPSIEEVKNKTVFLDVLEYKIYLCFKNKLYKDCYNNYLLFIELIQLIQLNFLEDGSKYHLIQNMLPVFEQGIKLGNILYEKEKNEKYINFIFQCIQKSKAIVLQEHNKEIKGKQTAKIPKTWLEKEQNLNLDLAYFSKLKYEAHKSNDSISLQKARIDYTETKNKLEKLKEKLEEKFPKYHEIKYSSEIKSIKEIQRFISKNELVLDYFIGKEKIYILAIQKENIKVYVSEKNKLEEKIQLVLQCLNDFNFISKEGKKSDFQFAENSHDLFDILLKEVLTNASKSIEKIKIIPDGILGFLPFEILLEKPVENFPIKYSELPYILKKYQISYAYSTQFISIKNKQIKQTQFAGFVPNYALDDDSTPLYGASNEVKKLAKMFDGDVFEGIQANENNFKNLAKKYNILHLSMHGEINQENPLYSQLIFSKDSSKKEDGFLTAAELYNLQFDAGLVVLSACNTGVGKLKRGEGLMSLARAFAFAGCPSSVMSLWKVSDESSAKIMFNFYNNLSKSKPKDFSLQQAKLDYLKEIQDPLFAHPYFWAGFVAIGDTQAIPTNNSYFKWLMFFGIVLFVFYEIKNFQKLLSKTLVKI